MFLVDVGRWLEHEVRLRFRKGLREDWWRLPGWADPSVLMRSEFIAQTACSAGGGHIQTENQGHISSFISNSQQFSVQ